ncbi:MAG: SusC/RagA family TonB-linked outer membrane protein [Bacteroidota bacterium]
MRKILFFLLMLPALGVFAQERSIAGKVVNEKGAPVPAATVKNKKSQMSVSADAQGLFTIKANTGDVLLISSTGFGEKQVTVKVDNNITIALAEQTQELTTVVVTTALGIQRQAKELGYASTTINNKTLTAAKSVNVQQALNGKISGVNISTINSGVFENAKINIRGIRSLTGNNQPMLVIDGAPTPLSYLSSVPPDDVQEITVLKSAASAALYGPDAVNGVIIINTKRGGKKPTVVVSTTIQATRISFFPKMQKRFGPGAGETVDAYGNYTYVPYENQQYGPEFDGSMQPLGVELEDGSIQMVPYSADRYKDKEKFWNTGLTLQNSVSISGEDFYVSVQDAKIKGVVPDDQNRRTSFRFNGGKTYGKFSTSYGLSYVLSNFDVVDENRFQYSFPGSYNGGLFFLVMQTASNVPLLDYKDWRNSKWGEFSNYYNEFAVNPYWLIGNIRQKGRQDDITGNLDLNYQVMPWLKATARISTTLAFANFKSSSAPVVVNDWAVAHRSATNFSNRPGQVLDGENFTSRINFEYFVSGDRKVTKDFNVRYVAGGSLRQNRAKDVTNGGNNLVVPFLYNASGRSGDAYIPSFRGFNGIENTNNNFDVQSRLLSAYGTFGISYRGWANVEVTGRNDWDSRLMPDNQSFFYPSVNATLVLSDAVPSLKSNGTISYVKLRGAVSKSGNVNLRAYDLRATYSQPVNFPYGNVAGYGSDIVKPSADLKPEFVNTKEVGIELGFLNNKINFEATYFNQNNTDQVILITQSLATGYPNLLANAADFKNWGVEMDLGLNRLINIGKGRIDLKINATYNNNEVTRTLNNTEVLIGGTNGFIQTSVGSPTVSNIAVTGLPAFAFQLTDYARDSATGKVIVDRNTGMPSQAGATVTRGRSLPLWVVGITPSYTIGNFSFSMTWDYKGGHDFYAGLGSDADNAGISARSAEYGRKRFVFPNSVYLENGKYVDNTNVQVQDGNYNFWSQAINTGIATNYFSSAAAWRLREVNISYSLPQKWIGNGKVIKRVTVSAVGKNLLLLVPKSNQWSDPEFNYSNANNTIGVSSSFQSPASRFFGGSLTVQF